MKKDEPQGIDRRAFLKGVTAGAAVLAAATPLAAQSKAKPEKGGPAEMIDAYPHILPKKYSEALFKKSRPCYYLVADRLKPALSDLDLRFKLLDRFGGMKQVLTLGAPPLEYAFSPKEAVDMARMANDGMAGLVAKYPDRFVAAVAALPLNDPDASLRETDRAIRELKFKGVQIFSSTNGVAIDRPELMPLYEKMAGYGLPIWLHPARDITVPDYVGEKTSKYGLTVMFAWPFETTLAMSRLVFSGVFDKYPKLKIVIHHCGAMIPFFYKRIPPPAPAGAALARPAVDYFKDFYTDTVLAGNTAALTCGHEFFGAEKLLFGTDYPYPGAPDKPEEAVGDVVRSVEQLAIPPADKARIFSANVRRLLSLA